LNAFVAWFRALQLNGEIMHKEPVSTESVRDLVGRYAEAKSHQDTEAALRLCTDDFLLHTAAVHNTTVGKRNVGRLLDAFFGIFPDYQVTLEDSVLNGYGYTCWGTLRMTMRGRVGLWRATHRTANLPFVCAFTIRDGLIASEHFFFDGRAMCDALGLPAATFERLSKVVGRLPPRVLFALWSACNVGRRSTRGPERRSNQIAHPRPTG
jgi:ketosteroid isomerase-like protein